jgi:hypothetical protein
MDFRAEAVYTDVPASGSVGGKFIYWEIVYKDSHTNKGSLLGDWVGREGKGYFASTTYWLSPRNTFQAYYRYSQVASDFIPNGVTLHDGAVSANFLIRPELSVSAKVQYEHLNAPLLGINQQSNVATTVEFVFHPSRKHR